MSRLTPYFFLPIFKGLSDNEIPHNLIGGFHCIHTILTLLKKEGVTVLKYFHEIKDEKGYTHSCDGVVAWYFLREEYTLEKALDYIHDMSKVLTNAEYWEQLGKKPSSKYDYYRDHIHLGDAFIKLGRYCRMKNGKNSKFRHYSEFSLVDCVRVEINPNKHHDTELYIALKCFIERFCGQGFLDRMDYAVDIPVPPEDVVVLGTRKTPGLKKGTRYFGDPYQHGFVRIYDKQRESGLDHVLTRVETVLKMDGSHKFSSVDFAVKSGFALPEDANLSPTVRLYVKMLNEMQAHGIDVQPFLAEMNYRTRVQVLEHLNGKLLRHDPQEEIFSRIVADVEAEFGLTHREYRPRPKQVGKYSDYEDGYDGLEVDEDGYIIVNSADDLPF